jgi:hypothetical protein
MYYLRAERAENDRREWARARAMEADAPDRETGGGWSGQRDGTKKGYIAISYISFFCGGSPKNAVKSAFFA